MKAIVYQHYGSPDMLELKELEVPKINDDEVLVNVHATSINSWDWDMLTGRPRIYRLLFGLFGPRLKVLGADISGTVEAIGKNVTRFKIGDEVFGDLCEGNWGGLAEYTRARTNALSVKPSSMTFEQAASIPQAGLLALQGLRYKGATIKKGDKVLINGGGGGVGTFAIQIAKHFGAEVTGVDSALKFDTMRAAGADHIIDYKKEDFTQNGIKYNYILDVVANRSVFAYRNALSEYGTFAMVGGKVGSILQTAFLGPLLSRGNKKLGLVVHKPNKGLDELINLFNEGTIKPFLDGSFSLEDAVEAFRYFGKGMVKGKIVVSVKSRASDHF